MEARIGANDGPGIWMPAGVRGRIGALPRRGGAARHSRRKTQARMATTSMRTKIGSSATKAPQSGMTN